MRYRQYLVAAVLVVGVLTSTSSSVPALTFSTIDFPGAMGSTTANGINDRGQIVGTFGGVLGNHGFLLDKGTFTTIDFPGSVFNVAFGINNRGQIVGSYDAGGRRHGFVLDRGTFTTIDFPGAFGAFGTSA